MGSRNHQEEAGISCCLKVPFSCLLHVLTQRILDIDTNQ